MNKNPHKNDPHIKALSSVIMQRHAETQSKLGVTLFAQLVLSGDVVVQIDGLGTGLFKDGANYHEVREIIEREANQ